MRNKQIWEELRQCKRSHYHCNNQLHYMLLPSVLKSSLALTFYSLLLTLLFIYLLSTLPHQHTTYSQHNDIQTLIKQINIMVNTLF